MRRRDFIAGLGSTAWLPVAGLAPVFAQGQNRVFRLGHLTNSAVSEATTREVTLPELARLGFSEGRNLVFDGRIGEPASMPGLMNELLAARPDAVVAVGPAAVRAAGAATRSVPVIAFGADPVELKLAQGYARPGGNVTGVVILISELEAKRLSILHEAAPGLRRLAALVAVSQRAVAEPALRKAAASLGIELQQFFAATPADYPAAFAAMQAAGAQALLVGAAPEFFRDGKQLATLAFEARLPTVCEWAEMAHAGCMIGYGPSRSALRKRIAAQIALVFGGTPAGEIAIEQPTLFEIAINQKIARSLDFTIPFPVLASADEVIE